MKKVIHKNKTLFIITGLLVSVTLVSGTFLSSARVSADNDTVVDQINITVPVSCSLTTTSGGSGGTYTASITNGTHEEITGSSMKIICNDSSGYAIYAIGYSGESYTDATHTTLIGSPASIGNIATGTATSGGTSDWAMWLTANNTGATYPTTIADGTNGTENFTAYHNVPNTYTKVAYRNSATDVGANAEGSTITAHYMAYMSIDQPAGSYSGKVKYTIVHPASEEPLMPQTATSGCINYFPNGSGVVGTMGCQSISASATSATLLASNFSRQGYGFAGWSDAFDYATNPNAHFYGPQEGITFTAGQYTGSNPGLALYAVWVKSAGSLQTDAASVCSNLTTAPTDGTANLTSVSALTDARDNETYAIAKLADGNCWMIENLRLESTAAHNSDGTLAQGYGTSATYGNFSGLADAENTGFTNTYTANSLYYSGTQEGTASIDIGTSNYPAYRMPRYNNYNHQSASANRPQNPAYSDATNSTTNASMYSYGNYYTWHAAIADLTHNGTDNSSVTNTSLCPSGWHLPTGGSVTTTVNVTETPSTWREFYNLGYGIMGSVANDSNSGTNAYYNNTTTNSNGDTATKAFRKFPNNFLYSGLFSTSSAYSRGSSGYYWSSTTYDYSYSYHLYLYSSNVRPGTVNNNKYTGFSIRCLLASP